MIEERTRILATLAQILNDQRGFYSGYEPIVITEEVDVKALFNGSEGNTVDIGLDSLDMIEFVMAIEDEYNIELDNETFGAARTGGDFVDMISAARISG
jgi:acyl carrier protein